MGGIHLQAGDRVVIVADGLRGAAGTISGFCADGQLEIHVDQAVDIADTGPVYVMTFHQSQVVPEQEWCTCDLRLGGCTCGAFVAEQARKAAALATAEG